MTVKIGPVTALQKTLDLCTFSAEEGLPCPIAIGKQTLNFAVDIPAATPKFSYAITATAKNNDGKTIVCLKGKVKITFRSGSEQEQEQSF